MRLGTTTFSFTNEWLARRFTRAELLERAAAFELGPGLEVVGQQLWRGYPILDRDEVVGFRRLCDRLGLEPTAIGGYVDLLAARDADDPRRGVAASRPRSGCRSARVPVVRLHVGDPGRRRSSGSCPRRARGRRARHRDPGRADAGRRGGAGDARAARAPRGAPTIALVLDFSIVDERASCDVRRRGSACRHAS